MKVRIFCVRCSMTEWQHDRLQANPVKFMIVRSMLPRVFVLCHVLNGQLFLAKTADIMSIFLEALPFGARLAVELLRQAALKKVGLEEVCMFCCLNNSRLMLSCQDVMSGVVMFLLCRLFL